MYLIVCYRTWNQQTTRMCVMQHTSQCSDSMKSLLSDVVDMSTRLVLASGACDDLSICFVQEAYHNVNQFSVAISTFTKDLDVTKLCMSVLSFFFQYYCNRT